MKPYRTIHDAATDPKRRGLARGQTEIWFQRVSRGIVPGIDPENLEATHVLLGRIACTDLEAIFWLLLPTEWSPHGEADDLIARLGLDHRSLRAGDIVRLADGTVWASTGGGWRTLEPGWDADLERRVAERAYEHYLRRVSVPETEDPHTWGDRESDWHVAREQILNHLDRDGNPVGPLPSARNEAKAEDREAMTGDPGSA